MLFNFVEIREPQDSVATTLGGLTKSSDVKGLSANEYKENVKGRRRSLSLEEVSLYDSDDQLSASETKDAAQISLSTKSSSPAVSGFVLDSDKKERWFSWKSRRFSFKRAKTKEEKSDEKTESCGNENKIDADLQPTVSSSVDSFSDRALQVHICISFHLFIYL